MNKRIKELRLALHLSQREFGEKIGLKPSTVNDLEHSRYSVNKRLLIAISATFDVNQDWLISGNGNMFNIENKLYNEFFEIYKSLSPACQTFLIQVAKDLLNLQNELSRE